MAFGEYSIYAECIHAETVFQTFIKNTMYITSGLAHNGNGRRSTRHGKKVQIAANQECKVPNSLKGHQYLPNHLKEQIENIDFLSQKALKEIVYQSSQNLEQGSLIDNLQKMNLAVQRQQENFHRLTSTNLEMQYEICGNGYQHHLLHNILTSKTMPISADQPIQELHVERDDLIMDKENELPVISSMDIEEEEFDLFLNSLESYGNCVFRANNNQLFGVQCDNHYETDFIDTQVQPGVEMSKGTPQMEFQSLF